MNRRWALPVLLAIGCVDVNGGAVELSWAVVKSEGGELTSCQTEDWTLSKVKLRARLLHCDAGENQCHSCLLPDPWACDVVHGSTLFEFQPGDWELSIAVAQDPATGQTASPIRVPDPIVRHVVNGEVTELQGLLIVVGSSDGNLPEQDSATTCEL